MTLRDHLRAETERLKATVSIAGVIAETLPLTRTGQTLTALCPFHSEKTPSFHVYKDGHYHCFGCSAHGDVFSWLMQARGMSFREAVAYLQGARPIVKLAAPGGPGYAPSQRDDAEASRRRNAARRIWLEAIDPHGTLVERYLQHRGVSLPDASEATLRGGVQIVAIAAAIADRISRHPVTVPSGGSWLAPSGYNRAAPRASSATTR
jgi:DNA primase